MKFAVLGLGGRGLTYAHFVKYFGGELVAVCDTNEKRKVQAREYGVEDKDFYTNEDEFWAKGKIADALIIATMDSLHHRQTLKALDLGYDILLEKPIATNLQDCLDIEKKAKETGRKVAICHVLRFAPLYNKMKEIIDAGLIGDIVSGWFEEGIGYYHYAHAYVRGNWRNSKLDTPLVINKNCHDLDIICWLLNKKCLSVSAMGNLKVFKAENAPEGSAKNCVDCKVKDTCPYNCFKIYNNEEYEKIAGLAKHGQLGSTEEEINASLSDRSNLYGRCVYHCDNDVFDHQIVNMQFEDGVTIHLQSSGFTEKIERSQIIFGTKGIIHANDHKLSYQRFGEEEVEVEIPVLTGGYAHHQGGDVGIVKQFMDYLETGVLAPNMTDISVSVMSHKIGFLAYESQKQGGKLIELDND